MWGSVCGRVPYIFFDSNGRDVWRINIIKVFFIEIMRIKINYNNLSFWLLFGALSVSSLNSKAAGLAWVLLTFSGVGLVIKRAFLVESFKREDASFARTWLIFTLTALLLKLIPTIYWHDSWAERHAEIRLFAGAIGAYVLFGWRGISMGQHRAAAWAVSITCALALALMLFSVREAAPTNPIPWAAAIALCSAWLLPMALTNEAPRWSRWGWAIGSFMGLLAVLISENRGAYGLVLLWPVVLFGHTGIFKVFNIFKEKLGVRRLVVFVVAAMVSLGLLTQSSIVQRPLQRIQVAVQEIQLSHESLDGNVNGSIGARLFMWAHSISFIAQSPWVGHGQQARKAEIVKWGKESHSEHVQSLGHVHNEYLHTLMDYGLWGFASLLTYMLGMFWMAVRAWSIGLRSQAWAMGGVLFIHATTGLTNVNFAHNYYPTMLSIVMSLILITPSIKTLPALKIQ